MLLGVKGLRQQWPSISAGIDASGLPEDLDIHHLIVNDWEDLEAPQNVCIASIPTVFNPSLAPPGKATVHAYTAGNEPYSLWEGLDRRSQEYKDLKVCLCSADNCTYIGDPAVNRPCAGQVHLYWAVLWRLHGTFVTDPLPGKS